MASRTTTARQSAESPLRPLEECTENAAMAPMTAARNTLGS